MQRSHDNHKEMQATIVYIVALCPVPFTSSGQDDLSRQFEKAKEDKKEKGKGGMTTSGNGQAWSSASSRRQWTTGKTGQTWLHVHLWCHNDTHG